MINRKRGIIPRSLLRFIVDSFFVLIPRSLLRGSSFRFYDKEEKVELEFLTNNLKLAATTLARLYKGRWQIEIFFKWIKQHLRVKTFIGTSKNAVMTQVWIAMILYLLLSFIKFQTKYSSSLLELVRVIRELVWDTRSFLEVLRVNFEELQSLRRMPVQMAFY